MRFAVIKGNRLLNEFQGKLIMPLLVTEEPSKMKRIRMSGKLAQDVVVACFGLLKAFGLMMADSFLEQAMGLRGKTLSS